MCKLLLNWRCQYCERISVNIKRVCWSKKTYIFLPHIQCWQQKIERTLRRKLIIVQPWSVTRKVMKLVRPPMTSCLVMSPWWPSLSGSSIFMAVESFYGYIQFCKKVKIAQFQSDGVGNVDDLKGLRSQHPAIARPLHIVQQNSLICKILHILQLHSLLAEIFKSRSLTVVTSDWQVDS